MLVHVKTPRTEINIRGDVSDTFMNLLLKEYGEKLEVLEEDSVDIMETEWFQNLEVSPGEVLKIYRENHNLSQAELGRKLGKTSRQFVSDMENGRRDITVQMAKKIGEVFEMDYRRFL